MLNDTTSIRLDAGKQYDSKVYLYVGKIYMKLTRY